MKRLGAFITMCLLATVLAGCDQLESLGLSQESALYLKEHSQAINLDSTEVTLDLLDEDLVGKKVILVGEQHGLCINAKLEMAILNHVREKAGVRYYLAEMGYSMSVLLNKYLQTGDERYLKRYMDVLKGTNAWTMESYEKWRELWAYNKKLDEEDRIQIIGIDIEHQYSVAIEYLAELIPKDSCPPVEISFAINRIIELGNSVNREKPSSDIYYEVEKIAAFLNQDIRDNRGAYQEFLSERFFEFDLVADSLAAVFRAREARWNDDKLAWYQVRDRQMAENFFKIYPTLGDGAFFGQWGFSHILQRTQIGVDWLATHLNAEDSPVAGQVLSIAYYYSQCEKLDRKGDGSYTTRKFSQVEPFNADTVTLFKLTGESSPFAEDVCLINDDSGGATTDYFQYIVLIQGSGANTPYN